MSELSKLSFERYLSWLEGLAQRALGKELGPRLTILRPATVPLRGEDAPLGGLFSGWTAVRAAGRADKSK